MKYSYYYNKTVHSYLLKKNIKNTKIGYLYLVSAIELGLKKLDNIYYIMRLYEVIAKKYKTNVSSVERAIRTAVKPTGLTSKEFISFAVYEILSEQDSADAGD